MWREPRRVPRSGNRDDPGWTIEPVDHGGRGAALLGHGSGMARSLLPALLDAIAQAGGVASAATLIAASSRATLRTAVAKGLLTQIGRGVYALTDIAAAGSAARSAEARSWARWTEPPTDDELKALLGGMPAPSPWVVRSLGSAPRATTGGPSCASRSASKLPALGGAICPRRWRVAMCSH